YKGHKGERRQKAQRRHRADGRHKGWLATILFALTVSPIVADETRLPRAPGAHVVTITPAGQTGSEPAIAVNPSNPSQVGGIGGAWAGYSTDGGQTFTAVQPAGESGRGGGDPSLAFDDKGNVVWSCLSIQ